MSGKVRGRSEELLGAPPSLNVHIFSNRKLSEPSPFGYLWRLHDIVITD